MKSDEIDEPFQNETSKGSNTTNQSIDFGSLPNLFSDYNLER